MSTLLDTAAATTIHPFERRGLGKAPFRFVGMGQQDRLYGEVILNRAEYERTGIATTTKPGGTCAYCGTGIVHLYEIKSADGKQFHVGCECVLQTGDERLIRVAKKAKLDADRAKRAIKTRAEADKLYSLLAAPETRALLATVPHPKGYEGSSLLSCADYMARHSGAAGRARTLKTLAPYLAR